MSHARTATKVRKCNTISGLVKEICSRTIAKGEILGETRTKKSVHHTMKERAE